MYIIGIDIAKKFHEVAIIDKGGNSVLTESNSQRKADCSPTLFSSGVALKPYLSASTSTLFFIADLQLLFVVFDVSI